MSDNDKGTDVALVLGFAAFAALLLGGLGVLLGGRIAGDAQRGGRKSEGPPAPGSVPASRHHSQSTSAR